MSVYYYLSVHMDIFAHDDCRPQQQSGVSNNDSNSSSGGTSASSMPSSPMSTSLLKRKHLMARAGASLDAEVSVVFVSAHMDISSRA